MHSQGSAAQCEQDAFGQKLADHAAAAGTQRCADREFPRAARRAGQQAICHVNASNEEHKTHSSHQHEKIRLDVAH